MGLLPMHADILPPYDDRIFKLLLTAPEAKPGLIKLIASIIDRKVTDVRVYANEIPVTDTREKAERFDVNCKIDDGSQINLEMQSSHMKEMLGNEHRNLKAKSLYYLTDLHSSQPAKGEREYDNLAKTYQITFCAYTVFPNRTEFMNSYSMRHDKDNELLHDAIHMVFVELSKLEELVKKPVDTMTDLEKWSLFIQYASDPRYRETVNQVIASEEVLTVAGELLMSISTNEEERARFRSRKKFLTDMASDLAQSRANGLAEGRAEGRAEGEASKALVIARNLLRIHLPLDQIAAATGLTKEEVEGLRDAD